MPVQRSGNHSQRCTSRSSNFHRILSLIVTVICLTIAYTCAHRRQESQHTLPHSAVLHSPASRTFKRCRPRSAVTHSPCNYFIHVYWPVDSNETQPSSPDTLPPPTLHYMDMISLLTWRRTCWANYTAVSRELHSNRLDLLARFLPDPPAFLTQLTLCGGMIVGEAALSYVLRDASICSVTLEVAIANTFFLCFITLVRDLLEDGGSLDKVVFKTLPAATTEQRNVTRLVEYRLRSGLVIIIYESATASACSVIAGMWTSALMNFVTEYTFGCAYPRLTLNMRGLLSAPRMDTIGWPEFALISRLRFRGFDCQYSSSLWTSYGLTGRPSNDLPTEDCGRTMHICPHQGRYFGDPGSLVVILDALSVDPVFLRSRCIPPYGPMATWRVSADSSCYRSCQDSDPLLPPFALSMVSLFIDRDGGLRGCHPTLVTIAALDRHLFRVVYPPRYGSRRYSI